MRQKRQWEEREQTRAEAQMPPCEVCGKPGTELVRDYRERGEISQYRRFVPDDKLHVFCSEHTRDSIELPPDAWRPLPYRCGDQTAAQQAP